MTEHYHREIPDSFQSISLRELLHDYWLLSTKLIHLLRINQRVLVNNSYQPMNTMIKSHDQVDLFFEDSDADTPDPPFLPDSTVVPEILFENVDYLVANKPSGIKTHANRPDELGSLMNGLAAYLNDKSGKPYNVHRLDQQTSGAILVSKKKILVPIFNRLIFTKKIKRIYMAWVDGNFSNDSGVINQPIGLDPDDKRKRMINGTKAVSAITHYQVIKRTANKTLVQLVLETGRTHQIRVHLAGIGHPILGDPLYNPVETSSRMMLHSYQIKVIEPFSDQEHWYTAPLPAEFENIK
ncbi:RluA family pseudouridine synthase [Pediococcus argentinicus]|nr:RluA family pseudouridine synthase [Pediococcus argentinicus]NKZ22912.1 RluA family pseudouridine synthase [Pediococcus argentinicus]GEP19951.1 pseudouridine synthase [Pediococcus argentinicus]